MGAKRGGGVGRLGEIFLGRFSLDEGWPVLPGPEIIFPPKHQKCSANFGKSSANLIKIRNFFRKYSAAQYLPLLVKIRSQILSANFIFPRPLLSFLAEISATWQHWLTCYWPMLTHYSTEQMLTRYWTNVDRLLMMLMHYLRMLPCYPTNVDLFVNACILIKCWLSDECWNNINKC